MRIWRVGGMKSLEDIGNFPMIFSLLASFVLELTTTLQKITP